MFAQPLGAEIVELNIQQDHVHLLVMVPPKVSISEFMGTIKGRTAIRVFNKFRNLKKAPIGVIISGLVDIVSTPLDWMPTRFASMSSIKKRRKSVVSAEI